MNRIFLLAGGLLAFSGIVRASPAPPLAWVHSSFTVRLGSEIIEFQMECPNGKLTKLSASRGEQVVDAAIDRLAELAMSESCSGVSTRASLEAEGSSNVIGVELTVEMSREYVSEKLLIFFNLQDFRFDKAQRLVSDGESTQVTTVQL